jgi:hypothetical protein
MATPGGGMRQYVYVIGKRNTAAASSEIRSYIHE